jgi:hypothetical protein
MCGYATVLVWRIVRISVAGQPRNVLLSNVYPLSI